jgi:hypothetical protein
MTPEERAQRMLERLPLLLQGGPNLRRLFEAMGGELQVMERATRRLLESRWYTLARGFSVDDSLADKARSELGSLGALVGLHPGQGESDAYFRQHITEFVRIHARGLSTARAVLELVSLVYLAEQPPVIDLSGDFPIGRFTVKDEDGAQREIRVELHDNPSLPASTEILGAEARQQIVTYNGGLDQAFPGIEIRALALDVTVPILRQEESGVDVIFLGTIPRGQTLTLRHGLPPLLDGAPADGPVAIANPTRFAASATDPHVFRFDTPEARFSFCRVNQHLPPLQPGENRWHYTTLSRSEVHAYIASNPELAAYATRALEKPAPPPIDVTFRWTEVTPASFELRIPAGYVPPHYKKKVGERIEPDMIAFFRDIQAALEYGRAAGVRATIGMNPPLAPEALSLADGPLQMTIDVAFAEEQRLEEGVTAVGPSIDFRETLPDADESFYFGGIFDGTRFNGSGFQ